MFLWICILLINHDAFEHIQHICPGQVPTYINRRLHSFLFVYFSRLLVRRNFIKYISVFLVDTYFSLHTTYITSQYNQVVLPSPSLPQSIGSKYWYKVMMILLLCMVNESWCLDVHMYPIHIPYRKRKRDRQ